MVADGVHMVRDSYVNWYVVQEDGRLTIVDAGTPAGWGLLEKEVRRLGRSLGDIEALVITHAAVGHGDPFRP